MVSVPPVAENTRLVGATLVAAVSRAVTDWGAAARADGAKAPPRAVQARAATALRRAVFVRGARERMSGLRGGSGGWMGRSAVLGGLGGAAEERPVAHQVLEALERRGVLADVPRHVSADAVEAHGAARRLAHDQRLDPRALAHVGAEVAEPLDALLVLGVGLREVDRLAEPAQDGDPLGEVGDAVVAGLRAAELDRGHADGVDVLRARPVLHEAGAPLVAGLVRVGVDGEHEARVAGAGLAEERHDALEGGDVALRVERPRVARAVHLVREAQVEGTAIGLDRGGPGADVVVMGARGDRRVRPRLLRLGLVGVVRDVLPRLPGHVGQDAVEVSLLEGLARVAVLGPGLEVAVEAEPVARP